MTDTKKVLDITITAIYHTWHLALCLSGCEFWGVIAAAHGRLSDPRGYDSVVHAQGGGAVCSKLVWLWEDKRLSQKSTTTCYYLSSSLPLDLDKGVGFSRFVWDQNPCSLPVFLHSTFCRLLLKDTTLTTHRHPVSESFLASSIPTKVVVTEWHLPRVHICKHRCIFSADL